MVRDSRPVGGITTQEKITCVFLMTGPVSVYNISSWTVKHYDGDEMFPHRLVRTRSS